MHNYDFKVNDLVIHVRDGLSSIVEIKEMNGNEYFLVKSHTPHGDTIYVPKNKTYQIIRHLMNEEEAEELLEYMKSIRFEPNSNTKQRRDTYKRKLLTGDIKEIAYLTMQLYFYNNLKPNENDFHLGNMDISMLSNAEKMLLDELSISFSKEPEIIKANIYKKILNI